MPQMQIFHDGAPGQGRKDGPGVCRGCGRKIWWTRSARGKPIPFDEIPDVIASDGRLDTVSTAGVHWSTCPKADSFKRSTA